MKKIYCSVVLVYISMSLLAQADDAANYAGSITSQDLKKHLSIIASDEFEGRETGTEGQRKAAAYIEAQFKKTGLLPAPVINGYQQVYPLHKDSMISSELMIKNKIMVYGKDYIGSAALNESGSFKGKKLAFVGYGINDTSYSDYKDVDVKGKIAVFFLGEPRKDGVYLANGKKRSSQWSFPGLSLKLAAAKKMGATGAIVINPAQDSFSLRNIETSMRTGVNFTSIPPKEMPLNFVIVSHEIAKTLLGAQAETLVKDAKNLSPINGSNAKVQNTSIAYTYSEARTVIDASNVVGIIEGSDKKDEYVFLTAHYDHLGKRNGKIYYGADDDGSGTCAVIEMAEAFSQAKAAGKGPRRTLVFMTVSGEEKGLWGSEYYSDHPFINLEKTSANLNTDMVGRIDTERKTADSLNYVYVIGHDKLSSDLPVINEGMNKKYSNLVLDYKYDDPADQNRIYYRSDHYNFARKGVPILFFYDGMLKSDYHQPTDTVDKIYWELYEKRVRMIFHTAWEIANREEMLKRDIPLPEGTR